MGKPEKIAGMAAQWSGGTHDPCYAGFFQCFNEQKFFEAHDVLEHLWLRRRGTADDHFYKGLIQLAGAFVHLQKGRAGPALALFNLAEKNLGEYGARHRNLDLDSVRTLVIAWKHRLSGNPIEASHEINPQPRLELND